MAYPVTSMDKLVIVSLLVVIGVGLHKPAYMFDQERAQLIFQKKNPGLLLFLGDLDESSPVFRTFSQLSNEHADLIFVYSRKGVNHYLKLLQFVGIEKKQAPIIMYRNSAADKFLYEKKLFGEFTRDNINQFITKVNSKLVEVFLRSGNSTQDLEDEQIEQNKKYLTYYNSYQLRDEMASSDKQFVIIIYGTWCYYSEKMSPYFTEVAQRLQPNKNFVFGKIDGNLNDVVGFQVTRYPTITLWFKDKSKSPIAYDGERDTQAIISWIKQNSEYPWVQPLPAEKRIEAASEQVAEQQIIDAEQQQHIPGNHEEDTAEAWQAGDEYEEIDLQKWRAGQLQL